MDELDFNPKLRNSWLVQRLDAPPKNMDGPLAGLDNIFSFGGGLINGGLSKEAMNLLRNVFSFDYMGSSEFEWGIVPSCLSFLAVNRDKLKCGEVGIKKDKPPVYYLCHPDHELEVKARIKLLATKPPYAKEHIGLDAWYVEPKPRWMNERTKGWLDCSNGFMFFIDKEMWGKTCQLFGVKTG
jgi:hypothetical protein